MTPTHGADAFDGHPGTLRHSISGPALPHYVALDMGEFYTSQDGETWTLAVEKTFEDLLAPDTIHA